MVTFSIFNELSLPFQNRIDIEEKFIDFFKVLKELEKRNLTKIRMDKNFKDYSILENISLQQFFGQLNNIEFKDKLREFITNGIIKIESPLILAEEEEKEKLLENEYFYEDRATIGGLACSDIWNTIAISFLSDEQWNNQKIDLKKHTISEEKLKIGVLHASQNEHVKAHKGFFDNLEKEKRLNITQENFWKRREEFFPNKIIFAKEIEKQIENIDKVIFEQAIGILRDVESAKKLITDYNYSGESKSVKEDDSLKKLRYFTIEEKKIFFENHIKSLPNANRIYFLEQGDRIFIGYVGRHLPTKKH